MSATRPTEARITSLYSQQDYDAILQQIRRRRCIMAIPCALLLTVLIISLIVRTEWLTIACTILIGIILIAGGDLFIKPLECYRQHLSNVLYGRAHEVSLPFAVLSEDVSLVDGVAYRALTCTDVDTKGRPYERLFYLDVQRSLPEVTQGDMLRIVHHDLIVADVTRS